jgi:hypothetical protein
MNLLVASCVTVAKFAEIAFHRTSCDDDVLGLACRIFSSASPRAATIGSCMHTFADGHAAACSLHHGDFASVQRNADGNDEETARRVT